MPIRVLVVEDSLTVRNTLCDVVRSDPTLELVGVAEDGKRAIELCAALRPDVVTMDMMMPVMSGLAATEYIMAYCPTPIVIVSSSTNRGELLHTYDALAAGAVDVLEKPTGDEPPGAWERQFLTTLKLVSRIRVITHLRGRIPTPRAHAPTAASGRQGAAVIGIGASSGGPSAVVEVLRGIPTRVVPLLVVLHLSDRFGGAFADWLDTQTDHRVAFATDGEPVSAARVILAPPGRHLAVHGGKLRLSDEPERNFCRPSIDVLFESLAREYGARAAACLLTGMGRDGAVGMGAVLAAGGPTIAQDEATSIVFGMPREAIARGAASRVLPLPEIGPALAALAEVP